MFPFIIIIFLCCFSSQSFLVAKIIEKNDLKDIQKYFDHLDQQSLVLWDVDYTLMISTDKILLPGNEVIYSELISSYLDQEPNQRWNELISQIFIHSPIQLVDSKLPKIISSLQAKGIPTLAFTAMKTGSFGLIQSMENWRINQLHQLGINFSQLFPQYDGLNWKENTPYLGSPAFKGGVLCSDSLPKGPVLKKFLTEIKQKPRRIIFFDDNLYCLKSVEKALKEMKIPFIGIHYLATKEMKASIDMTIAHYQFQTLLEKGIWLTDQEAQRALK